VVEEDRWLFDIVSVLEQPMKPSPNVAAVTMIVIIFFIRVSSPAFQVRKFFSERKSLRAACSAGAEIAAARASASCVARFLIRARRLVTA
jgi:hypothetical protein